MIVKIYGGLGNQMFQYASALAASKEIKCNLMLDLSWYSNMDGATPRRYQLRETFGVNKIALPYIAIRLLRKLNVLHTYKEKREFYFDSEIFSLSKNIIMDGYWQSNLYFEKHRALLLKEFTINSNLISTNVENLKSDIEKVNSVSLHIRRGDYVSNSNANSFHGVCSLDYYYSAIERINDSICDNFKLYIFSDDIAWVKENLKLDIEHQYITGNSDVEDLYLMQNCKHNIIANSSFSWWGAYLNSNKNKIIVAPKQWNKDIDDGADLIPNDWIQL